MSNSPTLAVALTALTATRVPTAIPKGILPFPPGVIIETLTSEAAVPVPSSKVSPELSNILISSNISWISSENEVAFNIKGAKDSVFIKGNNIYGWQFVLRHNDILLRTIDELNNYREFMDIPENNYSRAD